MIDERKGLGEERDMPVVTQQVGVRPGNGLQQD